MLNVCFGDSERGLISYALDGEKVMYGLIYLEYGGIHPDSFKKDRSDSFIAERIESLIDAGELVRLKACSKRNRNYYSKTILRLATDKDVDTEFKKKRKK